MATFNKINAFVEDLAEKVHNLGADQLKVALTNIAPTASSAQLSDISEIGYTNLSTRNVATASSSQTGGTYSLVLTDLVLTASGTVGPFRYVYLYNDSSTNDRGIGWWDRGSSLTMENGDTLMLDFASTTISLS